MFPTALRSDQDKPQNAIEDKYLQEVNTQVSGAVLATSLSCDRTNCGKSDYIL